MDELVKALGMAGISKSQVSRMCAEIDERVRTFLKRPIEGDRPSRPCLNQGAIVALRQRTLTAEKGPPREENARGERRGCHFIQDRAGGQRRYA
jgi:Transposase, Mutator family